LVQPGRCEVPHADGGDDPVVGCACGESTGPVRTGDGHLGISRLDQARPGQICEIAIDVQADHLARWTDQTGDQRGVVARAGPDLEHSLPRLHIELVEHDRHDRGLRRRADREPVRVALGDDGLVGIDLLVRHTGKEHVPRHRPQRLGDPVGGRAPGTHLRDKALAQGLSHAPSVSLDDGKGPPRAQPCLESTWAMAKTAGMARRQKLVDRRNWASLKPFGIGERRPNNYLEIVKAIRENRGRLRYAWRILREGTCDGCALGTKGMRDWTIDEIHLCNVRLRLLRLNTMPALDGDLLRDVAALRKRSSAELRELGRLPYPMVRHAGEPGFRRIDWEDALELVAGRLGAADPHRVAAYLTSRGQPNENYFAAQKAMRALGTNSIDNAARICHSPSTFGLKGALGVAATTCSYTDWIGTDLIVFIGSNVANNQPVAMKYLYHAKKAGTKVVCVNAYREPGMERYWVPSNVESAVFGTKVTDRFFDINVGGDIGFLNGVLKHMAERDWVDRSFVDARTTGFGELAETLAGQSWADLEAVAGTSREEMLALAELVHGAKTAVFVWSMGVTQHEFGEDNVRAIINLGLSKGFVGRPMCGLMPIRGHSGVQGGAEMGAYATVLPGGSPVDEPTAARFSALWGFDVPSWTGLTAPEMIDAAHSGRLDVLISSGGNFTEVLPDPAYCREALSRIPLRVHIDICLSSQMLLDPAGTVVLLPAQTRYEMAGGVTETSTERRVIFSPEVPGPRVAGAWPEYRIFGELAARVRPDIAPAVRFEGTADIRADIAKAIPLYDGIQHLATFGDSFQYGGPHLCADWQFPTDDGRARFSVVRLPELHRPDGTFVVATRRGKQFNSMVQEHRDPLTGAVRDAVLVNPLDADRLGLADGDRVVLSSASGTFTGLARRAPVTPGNLQVHWPEGEVLIDRTRRSPQAHMPDYNAIVTVQALR
jgi:molybdopterin-dependent oxidoreductase alpha subunit